MTFGLASPHPHPPLYEVHTYLPPYLGTYIPGRIIIIIIIQLRDQKRVRRAVQFSRVHRIICSVVPRRGKKRGRGGKRPAKPEKKKPESQKKTRKVRIHFVYVLVATAYLARHERMSWGSGYGPRLENM